MEKVTVLHYEQHRNVARRWNDCVLRYLRRLGMLQVLGSPPRVRDLNKGEGRGVRTTPLVFYLPAVSNSLTRDCYNMGVWKGEDG